MIQPSFLLRRALLADAIFSGTSAVLLSGASGALAGLTRLPQMLLLDAGLFLIPYAALVGWMASRGALPRTLVLLVIAGNAAWTLGSIALLAAGPIAPNAIGMIALMAQAIAVGVFAELEFIGLRKSEAAVRA